MLLLRNSILLGFAVVFFATAGGIVVAQDPAPDPAAPAVAGIETEGPVELLKRGRAAFAASNFAEAEQALGKFVTDYGADEQAKEAARIHTPMVAISKVGLKKFDEALVWIDRSFQDPELPPTFRDELSFWKGICLMTQQKLVEAQEAFGEYWANENFNAFKRYEALLLFATLYLQQEFPAFAADFLEGELPKFRDKAPEAASRAVVLQLYARLAAKQNDKALELLKAEYPRMNEMTQVISFQTLAMQLGASFLEAKDWHNAIACLQRIWPRERLLEYQNAKIAEIEERIDMLKKRPNTQSIVFQLEGILKRVRREMENFQKMENFDSALRLRLAMSLQGLGRYREAALVMEEMLKTMPQDKVVDSASLALVQCWMEIERWPKAIEAADLYFEKFGETGENLATVLFFKAEALKESLDFAEAQLAYGELVEKFPEDPIAPKAVFMQGFLYLQQDDNDGAQFQFDQVIRKFPDSPMVEAADYWTGMALSFAKDYVPAREHMQGYLDRHDQSQYKKEALFRIAVCTFSNAEYVESIALFEDWLATYAGDPMADEANLLLGDAYFGEGDAEKGFAAYEAVRPSSVRFFEDAWFKKGKAMKLLEEFEQMRGHYEEFVKTYPTSNRMPEAVYWMGWVDSTQDQPAKAREIYWQTIDEFGNDPDMTTVVDLFSALPKAYKNDGEEGRQALLLRLEKTMATAEAKDQKTLALRAAFARANLISKKSPQLGQSGLLAAGKFADPKIHNPMITVAIADAQREAGNLLVAKKMFTEIRKWNPRAVQKDKIYAGLGAIAETEKDYTEAIKYYEKFEKETASSTGLGDIQLAKARIYAAQGQKQKAQETLETMLEGGTIAAATKAKALYDIGQILISEGETKKATAYFERVYVAYGKFGELNAKAYWARGEALEDLKMLPEALEVYQELASRDDLSRYDEFKKVGEKISRLEPLVPKKIEPEVQENANEEVGT